MTVPPKKPLTTTKAQSGADVIKPVAPPPFQIKSKAEREKTRWVKILVYADFGIGKTYLAGTASSVSAMNDVIAVSAEAGELTWDSDDSGKHKFENIDSIRVTDYKTVARIYEYLKLHCDLRDDPSPEALDKLIKLQSKFTGRPIEEGGAPRRYRTVIIDSLTEVESYCMMQLLNISDKTGLQDEVQTAEWSEYKKQHSMVQRLVRAYRDLPMHVIFVCSRSYIQDDQKRMIFSPAMTGKLSNQIQGFMDIVGYLTSIQGEDGKTVRRLHVQPVGRYAAKCRLSNYRKPYWDDPTMAEILKDVGMLGK